MFVYELRDCGFESSSSHLKLPNCLSVFDNFKRLAFKGLTKKVCSSTVVITHVSKYFINSITFFRSFAYF